MKIFRKEDLATPPADEGWNTVEFGFSLTEARIISYLSLAIFFGINGTGFYWMGDTYLNDIRWVADEHPVFRFFLVALAVAAYYAAHESIHAAFFPNKGRGPDTKIGIMSFAVFVLYNNRIGRNRFMWVSLAPALIFLPFIAVPLIVSPGFFALNLIGLHFTACLGDFMLFNTLRSLPRNAEIWTTGSSAWTRHFAALQ